MNSFETPNELTGNMKHKESSLEAITNEIKQLEKIIEKVETASTSGIKDMYVQYKNHDEETLKEYLKDGVEDGPDLDDTEGIISYFESELEEVKREQKEKAANTN